MIFSRFFYRLKRKRRSLVYYFKPGPLKKICMGRRWSYTSTTVFYDWEKAKKKKLNVYLPFYTI